jgi:hypothetical protein
VSPFRPITGNALEDSLGVFLSNPERRDFALILWLEGSQKCLIFDGVAVLEENPVQLFRGRKEVFDTLRQHGIELEK